jgi:hypothetical protein
VRQFIDMSNQFLENIGLSNTEVDEMVRQSTNHLLSKVDPHLAAFPRVTADILALFAGAQRHLDPNCAVTTAACAVTHPSLAQHDATGGTACLLST